MLAPVISTVLVGAFLLIPGAIPGLALTRRTGLDAPAWIVFSALVSSSAYAIVYVAAMVVPITLVQGIWLAVVLFALVNGLVAFFWLKGRALTGRGVKEMLPPWSPRGLYVLGGVMLASWIEGTWLVAPADSFYHLAAARSLIEQDALLVTDPLYGTVTSAIDPTSGLFHSMFAMWSVVRGADVLFMWAGMAAVATVLLAAAFWTLVRVVTGSDRAAMWGTIAFLFAGLFADLRAAPYPSTIALVLVIFSAALLTIVWDRRSLAAAGMAAAAALVIGMTHLGTAELLLIIAFALSVAAGLSTVLFRGMRGEDRPWVSVAGLWGTSLVVLAIVGASAVSRLRVIAESSLVTIGETASEEALAGVVSITESLAIVAPGVFVERGLILLSVATLLGIAMAAWGIRHRSRVVIAGSAVTLLPALLMLDPPVTGWLAAHSYYMLLRLAAMLHFTPFVGLAWLLWRAFFSGRKDVDETRIAWSKVAAALVVALLVAGAFPYIQTVMTPWPSRSERIRAANESIAKSHATSALTVVSQPALGEFRETIGDDYPRVAAKTDISYTLAGIVPVSVVASPDGHSPMSVELVDGPMRREAMEELMRPNTPGWRRAEIVDEYEADYVFVWIEEQEDGVVARSFLRQEEYFEPAIELYNVRVFEVKG